MHAHITLCDLLTVLRQDARRGGPVERIPLAILVQPAAVRACVLAQLPRVLDYSAAAEAGGAALPTRSDAVRLAREAVGAGVFREDHAVLECVAVAGVGVVGEVGAVLKGLKNGFVADLFLDKNINRKFQFFSPEI